MFMFEFLMDLSERWQNLAINEKDQKVKAFYYHASEGFKIKANNLTINEAAAEIC